MVDFPTALLTSCLTVFAGVLTLVFGQIVIKFLIEPMQERSRLIGEIATTLIVVANATHAIERYYADRMVATAEGEGDESLKKLQIERYEALIRANWAKLDEARTTLRRQSGQLMQTTNAIPLYRLWARLGIVPSRTDVIKASQALIGLSNADSMSGSPRIQEVAMHLRIKVLIERLGTT
jgi:hypothetical protein